MFELQSVDTKDTTLPKKYSLTFYACPRLQTIFLRKKKGSVACLYLNSAG